MHLQVLWVTWDCKLSALNQNFSFHFDTAKVAYMCRVKCYYRQLTREIPLFVISCSVCLPTPQGISVCFYKCYRRTGVKCCHPWFYMSHGHFINLRANFFSKSNTLEVKFIIALMGSLAARKIFSDVGVHCNHKVVPKTFFECPCQRGKQVWVFFSWYIVVTAPKNKPIQGIWIVAP